MEADLVELKQETEKSKDRQLKSPFKRLSAELFVETMRFTDSPSLAISSSVCKSWNKSILESTDLFRHFEMEGKVSNIIKGIKSFGMRSGNSIKSIDLKIGTEATSGEQDQLQESMTPSSGTLKSLSVSHEGDLSELILKVASDCTELKSLISNKAGAENSPHPASLSDPCLAFPLPWKPKLQTFDWQAGGNGLICDDALLGHLQDCRGISLCSQGVQPAWAIKLFSSNSKLVKVEIPWIEDETVTDIPPMNLPDLEILYLDHAPQSEDRMENENGNGNANANVKVNGRTFFTRLCAPALTTLHIFQVDDPRDLSGLQAASLIHFCVWKLVGVSSRPQEAATSLISSMKEWTRLSQLEIELEHSIPANFWKHLISLLSILSKESIRAGNKDFLFLRLESIRFASTDQDPISAVDLSSMVASRIAVHSKLSYKNVLLSAQGDFEACRADPPRAGSDEEVPFADLPTRKIRSLGVRNAIEGDAEALSWLPNAVDLSYRHS